VQAELQRVIGVNLAAELRRFERLPASDLGLANEADAATAGSGSAADAAASGASIFGRLYGPPITFLGRCAVTWLCLFADVPLASQQFTSGLLRIRLLDPVCRSGGRQAGQGAQRRSSRCQADPQLIV